MMLQRVGTVPQPSLKTQSSPSPTLEHFFGRCFGFCLVFYYDNGDNDTMSPARKRSRDEMMIEERGVGAVRLFCAWLEKMC